MKKIAFSSALLASLFMFNATAAQHDAMMTPMQQAYQQQMDKMHQGMMAGMMEKNPDRAFARSMLAHHIGAVDMAKTELQYGKDPEMRKLAENIIAAQQQEITQMQEWLKAHPDMH